MPQSSNPDMYKSISVKEIIHEDFPLKYGIPHFQRGLVWTDEDISLLLESLYYETPCGGFVFWKPISKENEKLKQFGKLLLDDDKDFDSDFNFFIIDGQQRIRNIREALSLKKDDREIWCINLLQVPELREILGNKEFVSKYRLFIKRKDPMNFQNAEDENDRRGGHRYNYLPLYLFYNHELSEKDKMKMLIKKDEGDINEKEFDHISNLLKNIVSIKIQEMLNKHFHFDLIKNISQDDSDNFTFAIKSYNRINKGGKRVEAEERAFAILAGHFPQVNGYLEECYRNTRVDFKLSKKISRNDYLKRVKEKNFGFKFYLRVLVQNIQYHLDTSSGSDQFSFDIINENNLIKIKGHEGEIFDNSRKQVKFIFDLILNEIKCDYFETLPETLSLQPIIQLLIQYPQIIDKSEQDVKSVFAGLILGILLANINSKEILRLIRVLKTGSKDLKGAIETVTNTITNEIKLERLEEKLRNADSLIHRYVLMLYWLERKNQSTEFALECMKNRKEWEEKSQNGYPRFISYFEDINKCSTDRTSNYEILNEEIMNLKLSHKIDPSRQHLIPYDKLKIIYPELKVNEGGARLNSHSANNIGNITWMSTISNSFDKGVGGNFLNLSDKTLLENKTHLANLTARFLLKSDPHVNSNNPLALYQKLKKTLTKFDNTPTNNPENERKKAIKTYEKLKELRSKLIAEGFIAWYLELIKSWKNIGRYEVIPKLNGDNIHDKIRKYGYVNEIEDEMNDLVSNHSRCKVLPIKQKTPLLKQIFKNPSINPEKYQVLLVCGKGHIILSNEIILLKENNSVEKIENLSSTDRIMENHRKIKSFINKMSEEKQD